MPEKKSRPPLHWPSARVYPLPIAPSRPEGLPEEPNAPRKGGELKGMPPHVYSNPEDLPANYYNGMWREHDTKQNVDQKHSAASQKMASKSQTSLVPGMAPAAFVRLPNADYVQDGPYCLLLSAAFVYFRRLGLTPILAINAFKQRWIQKQLPIWRARYGRILEIREYGEAQSDSSCIMMTLKELDVGQRAGRLAALVVQRPIRPDDIWSTNLIGAYPSLPDMDGLADLCIHHGNNTVRTRPQLPSPLRRESSMQLQLFAGYQEPRNTQIKRNTALCLPARHAQRGTLPYVLLQFHFHEQGVWRRHAVMVDFSDRQHPGIFDPNFGCMEPQQGFNFLDFELVLNSLWDYYTNFSRKWPLHGSESHTFIPRGIYVTAFQLHEQVITK